MNNFIFYLLILAIVSGQLLKLPPELGIGITFLDLTVGIICFLGIFRLKKFQIPNFYKLVIFFSCLALLSLILTPLNLNPQEYLISFSYLVRFLIYTLFGFLIYHNIFSLKERVSEILIYSGIGIAVIGILQFFIFPDLQFLESYGWDPHYLRVVSTLLDPNFTGNFLGLTLLLLLTKTKKSYLLIGLVFMAFLATFSRGAYLSFLTALTILTIINRSKKYFILTLSATAILLSSYLIYSQLVAEPRNIDRENSANLRINSWGVGIKLFQNYPILGTGFNSYRYATEDLNLASQKVIQSHGGSTNDSSLLFVLATTGIIGLISYLVTFLFLFKSAYQKLKKKGENGGVVFAAIGGLLIGSFFSNLLFYPWFLIWIYLLSNLVIKETDTTD